MTWQTKKNNVCVPNRDQSSSLLGISSSLLRGIDNFLEVEGLKTIHMKSLHYHAHFCMTTPPNYNVCPEIWGCFSPPSPPFIYTLVTIYNIGIVHHFDTVNHLDTVETGHMRTPSTCSRPPASSFPGLRKGLGTRLRTHLICRRLRR